MVEATGEQKNIGGNESEKSGSDSEGPPRDENGQVTNSINSLV